MTDSKIHSVASLQARYDALTPAEKATPAGRLMASLLPVIRLMETLAEGR